MSYLISGSPLSAVQQAIYFLLNNNAALRNQVNAVFDFIPNNYPYPYVALGDMTSDDYATFTNYGEDVRITIHIFTRNQELPGGPQGKLQAQNIMYTINSILSFKIFPLGTEWSAAGCLLDFSHVFMEPDGVTWQGVLRFRLPVTNKNSIYNSTSINY